MTLSVKDIPMYNVIMISLSTFGGVVGTVVCLVLLINVCVKLREIRNNIKTNKKKSRKSAVVTYTLCIFYLLFAMLSCISYGFVRNNIITQIDINNFTKYQCIAGYFSGYILGIIGRIFLYILFVHRIKAAYNGSAYDYNKWVYRIIFLWCAIALIIWMSSRLIMSMDFILDYNETTGIIFCANPLPSRWSIGIYAAPGFELITNISLLFMFIKGLHSLRQSVLKSHIRSRMNVLKMTNAQNNGNTPVTFGGVMNEYKQGNAKMDPSMKTLINLHKLMKKQTLLVITALLSGMVYWGLVSTIKASSILITWDMTINTFCVWLMLGSSNKYWLCCTKYGLCCCCYKEMKCNINRKIEEIEHGSFIVMTRPTSKHGHLADSHTYDANDGSTARTEAQQNPHIIKEETTMTNKLTGITEEDEDQHSTNNQHSNIRNGQTITVTINLDENDLGEVMDMENRYESTPL